MQELDLLIQSAKQAGDIALGYWKTGFDVEDKPNDAGPVTDADLAVDHALKGALLEAQPEYGWLSEETADSPDRLDQECVFIVDPIDGTRSFISRDVSWAHSLAIVKNGEVTHGVIYLPAKDLLFSAAKGQGAFLNGAPIKASETQELPQATLLGAKPVMDVSMWKGNALPGFQKHYRPSLAYRMALVAEGRFDAMLTLRPTWEWDICAGALIALEAGAIATDKRGGVLRFNNAHPQVNGVLAGTPKVHEQLLEASDF